MRRVSEAYKQAVYQKGEYALFARHFLPSVLFKIIDVDARTNYSYTASSSNFMTEFDGLVDDRTTLPFTIGTLEPYQFLLSKDNVVCMAADSEATREALSPYGWFTDTMSDADGNIEEQLTCSYPVSLTTVGRTLVFDPNNDSVPSDFDVEFYKHGTLLDTVIVTGNTKYIVSMPIGLSGYDQVIYKFHKTSKPFRRIRLIEDVPGIYVEYRDDEITSLTVSQAVDIFMNELITGEMDLSVQNVTKHLDILNNEGIEKYLQRRQPIEVYLNLIFPDNTSESVLVGSWRLATWKSNKGALEATFTVQDPSMQLAYHDYIKGVLPTSYASLYDLAVDVLTDAGITKYEIDIALKNKYTKSPLPIATHKELLRLIAQAGQCVVLPTDAGGIKIKSITPLVYASNKLRNGNFSALTGWTVSGATLSQDYLLTGDNCLKFTGTNATVYCQQSFSTTRTRQYYVRCSVLATKPLRTLGWAYLMGGGLDITPDITQANVQPERWTQFSGIFVATGSTSTIRLEASLSEQCMYVDGFMVLDLTLIYGAGHEPSAAWCDQNIRFFNNSLNIPKYVDPTPVDDLDYSILIDAPEVELDDPVDSVLTKIYSYSVAEETSECYKAQRVIAGTEEFEIRFNSIVKSPVVVITRLDSAGEPIEDITATALLSATFYARAAVLKVRANETIQIQVGGYKVEENATDYVINSNLDPRLIIEAESKTIDNKLITYNTMAEDVSSFAIYWYSRRYRYDFDWRQNPAVELLDTVTVHDDFNNNNGVLLTDLDIQYQNGVLSGSGKGRY